MDGSSNPQFSVFDPAREVERTRRSLPHWHQPDSATFITFRTADSLPKEVLARQRRELEDWLARKGAPPAASTDAAMHHLPKELQSRSRRLRDRVWHSSLDECHGACLLRRPELARIVGDALRHFDSSRYHLDSFVIMPNHVHVLVQFGPSTSLSAQSDSWLRYTAREINRVLNRSGRFWQGEPFDHLVRSAEQFEYLRKYIRENPRKANLPPGEYLYWTRAARFTES